MEIHLHGPFGDILERAIAAYFLRGELPPPVMSGISEILANSAPLEVPDSVGGGMVEIITPDAPISNLLAAVPGEKPAVFSEEHPDKYLHKKFTAERIQLAVDMRADGVMWLAVFAAVNGLPGPKIASVGSLQEKFKTLKRGGELPAPSYGLVAKPPRQYKKVDVFQNKSAAPVQSALPKDAPRVPVRATQTDIDIWARQNGVAGDEFTLTAVNARRAQVELAPFMLKRG